MDSGQLVMQGFGDGLGTGWDKIEQQLAGYTASLDGVIGASSARTGTNYSGGAQQPVIVVVQSLEAKDWRRVIEDSTVAADFARNFGSELGLFSGMP